MIFMLKVSKQLKGLTLGMFSGTIVSKVSKVFLKNVCVNLMLFIGHISLEMAFTLGNSVGTLALPCVRNRKRGENKELVCYGSDSRLAD
jgi:hypothetical protein